MTSTELLYPAQQLINNYTNTLKNIQALRPQPLAHLLVVSKTQPIDSIRLLFKNGQMSFAENYLQEARLKQEALLDLPIEWHYIGQIQRNKTKEIANHFSWVHSVDRLLIAERLATQRSETLPALNICLQVNLEQEASKGGCTAEELPMLVATISRLPHLCLRGLMVIPSVGHDHNIFMQAKKLFDSLKDVHGSPTNWDTLSMGMSNDYEDAIACGSTLVRLGSVIFGARLPKN